jgi:hypothetical protein
MPVDVVFEGFVTYIGIKIISSHCGMNFVYIIFGNSGFCTVQEIYLVSNAETDILVFVTEIIAIYFHSQKHANSLYKQNKNFNVKADGTFTVVPVHFSFVTINFFELRWRRMTLSLLRNKCIHGAQFSSSR